MNENDIAQMLKIAYDSGKMDERVRCAKIVVGSCTGDGQCSLRMHEWIMAGDGKLDTKP